ncbi:MAG TPA: type III secretion system stator protein SctL [Trinickia sp.]|jgi:type III secretion protein L|nr:type III secretion system stator protein SctL [Trinickia sp.]
MVIWLRNPQAVGAEAGYGVGVANDVVRGEHLAAVVEIDAGYRQMQEQCAAARDAAREQAKAIVDEAQAQANALSARAQEDYASAAQRGYDAGRQQALTDWHERSTLTNERGRTIAWRNRERLTELVALAVEQIIGATDPQALFARAAMTVERIVADGSPVHVLVHPADLAAASAAFSEVALGWREAGRAVRLQVRADPALAPGACVCDTDIGTVDASLSLQLAAMRDALSRAVQSVPDDTSFEEEAAADSIGANRLDADGREECDARLPGEPEDADGAYANASGTADADFAYGDTADGYLMDEQEASA